MGVKDVQVEELWQLDAETLKALPKAELATRSETHYAPNVFFAKQVINNACATQAIISILLNAKNVQIGPHLTSYKNFAVDLPPDVRGLSLANVDAIRTAHNSFARPEPFVFEGRAPKDDDDVYHFISYLPIDGVLYELDGLQEGPIRLCQVAENDDDWLDKVVPHIQARIERYSKEEISFNLLALVKDRRVTYTEQLQALRSEKTANKDNAAKVEEIEASINELKAKITQEEERFAHWAVENKRRQHNYIPFIMNLLDLLAQKGSLPDLIEKAKKKKSERVAEQQKQKKLKTENAEK